jgi:beta-glucosidase
MAVLTRVDPTIDYDWVLGSPDPLVNPDQFSVIWATTYIADYTGPHTFFTDTDDGAQLFVDLNQDGDFDFTLKQGNTQYS